MNLNNYFIVINPSINILKNNNFLINFIKIIFFNIILFFPFILIGKNMYLNQLLKIRDYGRKKENVIKNIDKKLKKNSVKNAYIKKEFKMLFKNPLFFIQCIYPVIMFTVTSIVIMIILIPKVKYAFSLEEYKYQLGTLRFDIEAVCIIIGVLQIIGFFNWTSVTAVSRDGKNAYILKYLPIDLYKQFIFKSIPQILVNTIISIFVLLILHYEISEISSGYVFLIFVISFLLNCINSFILVLMDIRNPKINWDSQYELLKNNNNKMLQYVLLILNILFLNYIKKVLRGVELNIAILIFIIVLVIIIILLNFIVYKFKNEIFKKIN